MPPPTEASPLFDVFEQVWVIHLERRPERLEPFWTRIEASRWPFRPPQTYPAIDAEKVGVPASWDSEPGAYGCLRSHLTLLERAISDDVESLLVLEDDAVPVHDFGPRLDRFMATVPDNWECLMLGGEHATGSGVQLAPGVVRPGDGGIRRTHCYGLRGRHAMTTLYHEWVGARIHCDWVMAEWMGRVHAYAPEPFLVGQSAGISDIDGRDHTERLWRQAPSSVPVVVLDAPRPIFEALTARSWHAGYRRDLRTGIDAGLRDLFGRTGLSPAERDRALHQWITMIQTEAAHQAYLDVCVVWHPQADAGRIRSLIDGRVFEISATTVADALAQLPDDIRGEPLDRVVLLRSSRDTMEQLRAQGWHSGHWRDEETGKDFGLSELLARAADSAAITQGLDRHARVLLGEVPPGGVVTMWDDEVTVDMFAATSLDVLEITATDPAAALQSLDEAMRRRTRPGALASRRP